MITGFENQTHELNEYEFTTLLPAMIRALRLKVGEENAVTSTKAIKLMKSAGYKINGARFRKVVNHIRLNGLVLNLVSTSRGYYVATSRSDCERYIESLGERIRSITAVHDAMQHQLRESTLKK